MNENFVVGLDGAERGFDQYSYNEGIYDAETILQISMQTSAQTASQKNSQTYLDPKTLDFFVKFHMNKAGLTSYRKKHHESKFIDYVAEGGIREEILHKYDPVDVLKKAIQYKFTITKCMHPNCKRCRANGIWVEIPEKLFKKVKKYKDSSHGICKECLEHSLTELEHKYLERAIMNFQ